MANPFAGTELKESNPFAGTEEKFVGMDANEILAMDVPVPSAPDLYFNQDIINSSFKDAAVEEGKLAQSEFKKVVSSKYLSVLSGANELDIQDNYEAYSSAHGFTGNHEADFQLIGNKFTAGRVNIPDDLDKIKKSDGRIWNSIMQGFLFDGIASLGEAFYRTSKQVVGNVATFEPHARGRQLYLKSQIKDLEKKVEAKYGDDLSVTMADDPDFYALRQAQLENDTITEYFNAKKQNVALFKKLEDWEATTRAYRYFEKEINFPVKEEFGKSFAGEFSKAAGNMVYSLGAFSISGPTGLGSNIGVIYQGAIDDARAHGATEAEAFDAGILELPAGAADAAIDRFLFTKFLKPFSGKMTVGQMSKLIAASTAAGGMSEGAEQAWNNINAKYLSKYDQTRMLDEGVLASIAIGAMLGAGVQTTSSGLSYILPSDGKVNSKAPTDEEYNLLSNLYTDEEIYEQGGKLLSNAVKGDSVAREEIRNAVNGNVEDNNSFGIPLQATIETEGVLVGDELFEETRGGLDRFHGTSTEITQLEEGAYASQNIFGQGLYTTDAVDVAIGYTKKGNGTQPTLYKIEEIKPNLKFYDMEAPLDNEITKIIDDVLKGTDFYGMQREGDIDGNPIDSLRKLYNEIRAESRELGWTADDVQELFEAIRVNLEQAGYDGIEHIGAANSKKYYPHTVKVYFNPQDTVELVKVNPDSFKLYNEPISELAEDVLGEYEIQPLPDSLSTFEKIAAIAEENIIEVVNKRIGKPKIPSTNSVAEGIEKAGRKLDSWLQKFMSVTTRIGDISKKAKLRVEEMDRQEVILTNEGTRETDPFINSAMKALKVATPEEKLVIKAEMRNGEYDKLKARGIAGIDRMRKFLMNRGNRIPGLSLRENYFPSHVDNYNGLITSLGQEPEGPFSDAIRKAEEKKGGKLTNREKEVVINGVLQTRDNAGVSFLKKRTIETVTPKQMEYYENPLDSLRSYNHRTADFIAKKEFLGQGVFDPYNISGVENVTVDEDSIQKYILEEIPDLTFNEEKELSRLLKARLQFRRSNKYINAYKTAVALKYVTGFKTVLVQTADLSMITYENALRKSFPNIKDRQQFVDEFGETVDVTLDLVGIDVIDQALAEAINTDSLIQKTALLPLKTMDIAMKQGLLNSVSNRWQKQSVSNPEGLKKELMEYFGNEEFVVGIVSDLQNKKVSGDLLLAFYSKISEYHPTGISQHTKFYMDHPNLRPLFVLKSFQFKRLDLIYRRSLKDMLLGMTEATAGAANGSSAEVRAGAARFAEGLANLIAILATMYTFETVMEMAYYQVTPRKDDDEYKFTDVYIDNVVNIIPFLSTWDLKNGLNRDNLFKEGLMKAIIPPTPIGAEPATKALGALLLENKTLEWNDLNTELPLVGWWFQEEKDDGRLKRTNRTRPKRGDN